MFDGKGKNTACEATCCWLRVSASAGKEGGGRTWRVVCGSMHTSWFSGLSVARCSLDTAAPHQWSLEWHWQALWRAVPVFCQGVTVCQGTDQAREWRRWLKWELWNLLLDNISPGGQHLEVFGKTGCFGTSRDFNFPSRILFSLSVQNTPLRNDSF